jgi:hypothetical protein
MHTTETKHKFIELRARDWSLRRIGEELGVDKSTLVIWNKDFEDEIENLRQIELEHFREQLLGSEAQRLQALARDYHRYTKELETRDPGRVPQYMLFRMVCRLREQVERRVPRPVFKVTPVQSPEAQP